MNIVLISNYAADQQESMLRYALLLAAGLTADGHQVRIVQPPVRLLRLVRGKGAIAKWIAYLDKYLLAPSYLRREARAADLVHVCDHSNSMYLRAVGDRPKLITCHDTLAIFAAQDRFPGISVGKTGRILQQWIARGLTRAPHVVCVSHKTRKDLLLLSGQGESPAATVISNPVNPFFKPVPGGSDDLRKQHGIDPGAPFFLHVGSNSWYKNRPGAVRIFSALASLPDFRESHLVLAGKAADAELEAAIKASGVAPRIHILQDVEDAALRGLYSDAVALLFPSREEGFGWPILEAQACGCVVVTTDRDPMREIAGGAAILIDPEDPSAAARVIERMAAAGEFPRLREAGLKNVQRFQEPQIIAAYVHTYDAVRKAWSLRHA